MRRWWTAAHRGASGSALRSTDSWPCGQPLLVAVVSALLGDAGDARKPALRADFRHRRGRAGRFFTALPDNRSTHTGRAVGFHDPADPNQPVLTVTRPPPVPEKQPDILTHSDRQPLRGHRPRRRGIRARSSGRVCQAVISSITRSVIRLMVSVTPGHRQSWQHHTGSTT
jgi:hypothetical protein